jgi:hypothetical protein
MRASCQSPAKTGTTTAAARDTFERVYIDREEAAKFAERQKKSPIVKKTRI